MHGSLDPEERVMGNEDTLPLEDWIEYFAEQLGWATTDDITVEIGGMSVYGIEGDGSKWSPKKGTRKYNKDAFIVIKNQSRR